jgi:hypothetical protein
MVPSHLGLPFDLFVSRVFPFLEEQIATKVALFNLRIAIRAKSMVVFVLQFSGAMATDGYSGVTPMVAAEKAASDGMFKGDDAGDAAAQ